MRDGLMSITVRASINIKFNVAKRGQDGRMRISDAQTSVDRVPGFDPNRWMSSKTFQRAVFAGGVLQD